MFWDDHEWMARHSLTNDRLVRGSALNPHPSTNAFRNNLIYMDWKKGLTFKQLSKRYGLSYNIVRGACLKAEEMHDPELIKTHQVREQYIRMAEYGRLHSILDALKEIGEGK